VNYLYISQQKQPNMKTNILILILSVLTMNLFAQGQAEAYIQEAKNYLANKDFKAAQMSLQDAINELNNAIAQQISESLPAEVNGLKATESNSGNAAALGMFGGGMTISKNYQNPAKKENQADLQVIANSPLMTTLNMYMNNPAMLGQGYKSVRVGTRRAILKSETEDFYDDNGNSKPIRSTELQIPLTQTLITLNLKGFATEADELAFANKLDVEKLRVALGE
jgi:hypothetical protein